MNKLKYFGAILVILFSILLLKYQHQHNNVCKTFEDYYSNRDANNNCYHNPNWDLSVSEIIQRHGYPVETHKVTTEDGYILTVFRIPYGKNTSLKKPGSPIFLQHGMTLNSAAFINTNEKSLGFILADVGYDVWLGNFRGNRYSRNHTRLDPNESKFWDFSYHELGVYDLPAQLDHVHNVTNKKIIYIGFSMGGSAALIYGTTNYTDAFDKIEIFINLAPALFMENSGFLYKFLSVIWPVVKYPLEVITNGHFVVRPLSQNLQRFFCLKFPFQMKACQFWDMLLTGVDYEQNDPETLPITLQLNADAVSIKQLTFFFQMGFTKHFQNLDYGEKHNMKVYGSPNPPAYNFSNILVPSYTIVAKNDLIVQPESGYTLDRILRKANKVHKLHVIEYEDFNHCDFLLAKDVVPLLYTHLLDVLNQLNS